MTRTRFSMNTAYSIAINGNKIFLLDTEHWDGRWTRENTLYKGILSWNEYKFNVIVHSNYFRDRFVLLHLKIVHFSSSQNTFSKKILFERESCSSTLHYSKDADYQFPGGINEKNCYENGRWQFKVKCCHCFTQSLIQCPLHHLVDEYNSLIQ